MRLLVLSAAALIAGPGLGFAQEPTFDYESFSRTSVGTAEIVLKFHNPTDKIISFFAAECAFLGKDGKAITVQAVIAQNIKPGSYAYAKSYGPKDPNVSQADCRVRDVDYQ